MFLRKKKGVFVSNRGTRMMSHCHPSGGRGGGTQLQLVLSSISISSHCALCVPWRFMRRVRREQREGGILDDCSNLHSASDEGNRETVYLRHVPVLSVAAAARRGSICRKGKNSMKHADASGEAALGAEAAGVHSNEAERRTHQTGGEGHASTRRTSA